jgi:cytosine/adenosine deaminase-related metal-dependent hydrolase
MHAVAFINADMRTDGPATLRIQGGRILERTDRPVSGDLVVDLEGDRLLPGLINAHDHLQLNGFPAPGYGRRYRNAGEWIADLNARIGVRSDFVASRAVPRNQRLQQGAVKNLLSGVTTVAHHDPLYPELVSETWPTPVLEQYGWSHSLGIDGDERVQRSYRDTSPSLPWIIHAAEGIDAAASTEFDQLEALGCMGPNTVVVHGVALDEGRLERLVAAGAALIWCPTSNLRLFGATADVARLIKPGRVALGTDSRLTGGRDLLDELRMAAQAAALDDESLESLVTDMAARVLRLSDRGVLSAGARADMLVLPAATPLSMASRKDVRLVMSGGDMRYGDRNYAELLMPESLRIDVRVDDRMKVMDCRVAALLAAGIVAETGVELLNAHGRAA